MRVLITGAGGFVGRHLARVALEKKNVEVWGLCRSREAEPLPKNVRVVRGDLAKPSTAERVIRRTRPDRIFHLAAQSSGSLSWQKPAETVINNYLCQFRLLEAVRKWTPRARVHIAGSSEAYGQVPARRMPVHEEEPLRPASPYGISKASQELLADQYVRVFGLDIVRTRAFTHAGPGQREGFMASDFARQVARMERAGRPGVLRVGNLGAVRDITDVRDVARAYWLALDKGRRGEVYNVCSGRGRSVREVVEGYRRLSRVRFEIRREPLRLRPHDIAAQVGDPGRFRSRTGWRPRITFEDTLRDLLDYWREKS